jgi:hypothetical protein
MMVLGALRLCRDCLRGRSRTRRAAPIAVRLGRSISKLPLDWKSPMSTATRSMPRSKSATTRASGTSGGCRRVGAACSRCDVLLHRSHFRGPIGDADVASSRAMPQRRRVAARHGEVCTDWPRNSRQDAGAHAPRGALSILDLTGCESPNGASAAGTLTRFARRVEGKIGVTVPVGLSYCKFLAKLASDLDKPRAFALVPRHEAKTSLAPQSVGRLWGVGRTARERLERLGFRLIGDLQGIDEREAVSGVV